MQHARGDAEASDAALAQLISEYGADSPYQVAEVYGARGDVDKAFEWLEKTFADHDPGLSYMKMDPTLVKIRSDPRWRSAAREDGPRGLRRSLPHRRRFIRSPARGRPG